MGSVGAVRTLAQLDSGSVHAASVADNCLLRNEWVCPLYVQQRQSQILEAVGEHVQITVLSIVIGAAIAFPLAVVARRNRHLRGFILNSSTVIYTIPSLALFPLLLPFTGLSITTVIIGLVLYSLTILLRNVMAGLESVPAEVLDAANGMGLGRRRLLWRVELPLALPTIFAGLRIATVSTVALTTIGAVVGYGGLGNLIFQGLNSFFRAQVLVACVLCVVLAVLADLLLLAVQRGVTPWQRGARA